MTFIINGTNITDDLIEDTLRIQDRVDSGIAQGGCQIYTDKITKNIPPYTLCTIDGVQYFIKSEATQDMQNTSWWTHDCVIMELTSILQCYILGTKCFSGVANHTDSEKIRMIGNIIQSKYGALSITTPTGLNSNHEFRFGAGTTMLQALTEIMGWYNYRPRVTAVTYSTENDSTNYITIGVKALDGNTTFTLDETRLYSKVYRQNVDDYGAVLESEMNNVVDRSNPVTFYDLTCRSEDVLFNEDQAIIKLPCKVEQITSFQAHSTANTLIRFTSDYLKTRDVGWTSDNKAGVYYIIKTFGEWYNTAEFNRLIANRGPIGPDVYESDNIAEALWRDYFSNGCSRENPEFFLAGYDRTEFFSKNWILYGNTHETSGVVICFKPFNGDPTSSQDITNAIVFGGAVDTVYTAQIPLSNGFELHYMEHAKWEGLEAIDQPGYAVYDSGGDKIYNLNSSYKDDFWHVLIGDNRGNFLDGATMNSLNEDYYTAHPNEDDLAFNIEINNSILDDFTDLVYNVTCYPQTNPTIMDVNDMSTRQINESQQKKFGKSYQLASEIVSFDNVIDSVKKTNEMLGQPEIELEYDVTGLTTLPEVTNKIQVDSFYYYITSITTEIHNDWSVAYINLCSSYSKIADAIGVESQYHSTRLPTDDVIERNVVVKKNVTLTAADISRKGMLFRVYIDNDDNKDFYLRPAVMIKDNVAYIYAEFEDNFSAGRQITSYTSGGNIESYEVPYGDSNNEFTSLSLYLDYRRLNQTNSFLLPQYVSSGTVDTRIILASNIYVHKDPREKITFTVICKYTE